METGKKNFTLDANLINSVSQLPDETAGQLFKHILQFVNGQAPVSDNILINLIFDNIKCLISKTYDVSYKRRQAGLNSAKAKKLKKTQQNLTNPNKSQQSSTKIGFVENKSKTIDYQEIINIFNKVCVELPSARLPVTDERKKKIDALLKVYTLDDIGIVFEKTSESNYLNGKVEKWKANIDWLLKPTNFVKVIEGNYDNVQVPKINPDDPKNQWDRISDAVDKYYN
jgi:hypothetical protein